MSSEVIDPATLFDTVSGAESAAGDTNYRCVYVVNTHATLTLLDAAAFLAANTPSEETAAAIGLGTSAISADEQTATTVGDQTTLSRH